MNASKKEIADVTFIERQQGHNAEAPKSYGIDVATGSVAGGDTVVITGRNLHGTTAVMFGVTAAASFVVDSDNQITAVTPAVAASTVDIAVTTKYGTVVAGAFTFA